MLSGAFRALRKNLLSIIVLALVCLAISGFVPQNTPELRGQKKRAGARQELEREQARFMGSGPSKKADMSGVQQLVDNAIKENKVVVFSKSYCPYCHKAKSALGKILPSSAITVFELDQRDDGSSIQQYLGSVTGQRTVPQVFINGKFIGGGDDTARLAASGELQKLLKEAGAL
ncbi:hypothetical protein WJX74_000114 [Apatococcus lobatus]|uniref:Glutaredoxin domain-containing protein n=1 Tax=Apatococcus lobatus TaxID=904363 RepID=A0AAW1SAN2_9CHLO